MNKGFIAVHRKLLDKSWYHKSNYIHVWVTLLLLATHKKREVWFAGKNIILEPGQLITGRKKLKEITGIPETTLERILDHFEKNEHQIGQQKSNKNRLITIINWSEYQIIGQQNGQQTDNKRTTNGQQTDTNNNEDNVDNENNGDKSEIELTEPERIRAYILLNFGKVFANSIGRYWKIRLERLIAVKGFDELIKALERLKEYYDYGFKKGFAKRFNKFEENPCFFDEDEYHKMLNSHKRMNGVSTQQYGFEVKKKPGGGARLLNDMIAEVGRRKGGEDV